MLTDAPGAAHVLRTGIVKVQYLSICHIVHPTQLTLFGLVAVVLMFPVVKKKKIKKLLLSEDRLMMWCYLESRCACHLYNCAQSFPFLLFHLKMEQKNTMKRSKDRGDNVKYIYQMRQPFSPRHHSKTSLLYHRTLCVASCENPLHAQFFSTVYSSSKRYRLNLNMFSFCIVSQAELKFKHFQNLVTPKTEKEF